MTRYPLPGRRLGTICLAMILLLAPGRRALAHAFPDQANPAAGSTLTVSPPAVVLHFTEALEPRFTGVRVTDATGKSVEKGNSIVAAEDPKRLTVNLGPLSAGVYKVWWHAVSVDTHKTQGSYTFTVSP